MLMRVGVALVVAALLVACGESESGVSLSDGDCDELGGPVGLVGVSAVDGSVLWDRTLGDAVGGALAGDVFGAISSSGVAIGVDATSGASLWCRSLGFVPELGSQMWSPQFASTNGVLATATPTGEVVGVDPESGQDLWRVAVGAEGAFVEAAANRFVLRDGSAVHSILREFDPSTGATPVDEAIVVEPMLRVTNAQEGQRIDVTMFSGNERILWSSRLPGLAAALHDDIVVTVDQTGGTGVLDGPADTVIAAFDATTGVPLWATHTPFAGFDTVAVDDLIVTPGGQGLLALDRATGNIAWDANIGSPGRGGRYSEIGGAFFIGPLQGTDGQLVVAVTAQEPYRD